MRIQWLAVAISFSLATLNAQTSTWRPVVMSDHGMVASGHPLASEAGLANSQGGRQCGGRGHRHLGRARAG